MNKEEKYRNYWAQKTDKQVQKECQSMRNYIGKHGSAYEWHGKRMTPPDSLSDGSKLLVLREILQDRGLDG